MEELNNLSKKERKSLRKQEREQEKAKNKQKRKIKKLSVYGLAILLAGGAIFGGSWWISQQEPASESEIISKQGLHWHPHLSIKILGEALAVPAGIGLERLPHKPLHTHDRDGVIHLEFSGLVKKNDTQLGNFFQIWGKTFNKDCIFDKCSGADGQLKMLVNGVENSEFDSYAMQNGDKIEIIFEKSEEMSPAREFIVSGTEYSFNPPSITVSAGERVRITFRNDGGIAHNFVVRDLGIGTKTIGGGKTDTVEFTAPQSGTYTFICSVPGHAVAGMVGDLAVE